MFYSKVYKDEIGTLMNCWAKKIWMIDKIIDKRK